MNMHEWEGERTREPEDVTCAKNGGSRVRSPSHRLPKRKRPAHGVFPEGGKPVVVFVTVCTKDRRPWLATAECHGLLREVWTEASAWLVGRYVVMPDHVHLFASPDDETVSLEIWMRYWKRLFTQRGTNGDRQWQSGHWDRRLRNTESYVQKWDYVRHNPVRHGLVADPAELLFQGEIHELAW